MSRTCQYETSWQGSTVHLPERLKKKNVEVFNVYK